MLCVFGCWEGINGRFLKREEVWRPTSLVVDGKDTRDALGDGEVRPVVVENVRIEPQPLGHLASPLVYPHCMPSILSPGMASQRQKKRKKSQHRWSRQSHAQTACGQFARIIPTHPSSSSLLLTALRGSLLALLVLLLPSLGRLPAGTSSLSLPTPMASIDLPLLPLIPDRSRILPNPR